MFPIYDIMTKEPLSIHQDMDIYEAINILNYHNLSGIPVVDHDKFLVGFLSEYDVLQILLGSDLKKKTQVKDFMTRNVTAFPVESNAVDICDFFITNNKRMVPILDQKKKLIGVICRHDIIELILRVRNKS